MCAWVSHLCMHKREAAHVCMRCPSVATADDHMRSTGWDTMEMRMKWNTMMRMKWNTMMRMKNHAHCVCTILHMHKVRGGGNDIPAVSFTPV